MRELDQGKILLALLLAVGPLSADAEELESEAASPSQPVQTNPLAPGLVEAEAAPGGVPLDARRERPKVDGVADRVTVGEVLAWVPRVVLSPLYLVSEYVVRRPLGWVVTGVEKNRLIPKFRHYTTIGEDDGESLYAGVDPIARFDTGFRFALGLLFWAENVGWNDSEVQLGLDTDFARNATVDFRWRMGGGGRLRIMPILRLEQRNDFRFYGVGDASAEEDQSRFFRRKMFGGLEAELEAPSPGVGAILNAQVSHNEFECSSAEELDICGDDGVPNTADDPFDSPGLLDSYDVLRMDARVYADSRPERPGNSTGARAEVYARWGTGLSDPDIQFIRTGAEASLFWDIYQQRVLGFRVAAETTLREGDVPFSELILPGGPDVMRGFARGRMHGSEMFVASLDYRYPVWSLADGTIFFEAGNAFDDMSDLELDALRGSFGVGLRSLGSRHVSLDALLAAGTTRFDDANFGIESVRLSIGTNWGF